MRSVKRAVALLLCAVLLCGLSACGNDSDKLGFQMELPQDGDTVAILHTSMGDVSVRLFPEEAPKTVENFITHAQNGYYDGLTFHRVINDFMIQGGDPKGDGTGGESIWGDVFEDEFDPSLGNLRGSLAMANSGADTNGSQFFINQAGADDDDETLRIAKTREKWEKYRDSITNCDTFAEFYAMQFAGYGFDPKALTDHVLDVYEQYGGNMNLDGPLLEEGGHTVFGQVYDGMDVVDAIAAVQTDENDKPLEDVIILSIEITTYKG